ncbi:MAG: hypothetical protein C5B48_08420 [Candidatus Rokuibacteriota bacterium]|nr:MAG: hypothetical protein C5B48_08420 [Candidatus Rokubacteria bacterium]
MPKLAESNAAPVPYFDDTRSLTDKLNATREPWAPHKDAEQPRTIYGLVIERGVFHSDYDKDEPLETLVLLSDDFSTEWSVVAFHGWLQSEIQRKQPQVGDYVALAYKGTKPARKQGESPANMYQLELERNPDRPQPVPAADAPFGPAADDGPPPHTDEDIPF